MTAKTKTTAATEVSTPEAVATPEPEATTPEAVATPEPEATTPEVATTPEPEATTPGVTDVPAINEARVRQLIALIDSSKFAPFDQICEQLDGDGLDLREDGPHTLCTLAGIRARVSGGARAAVFGWPAAARRMLAKGGV